MRINVIGKHMNVTEAIRTYAEGKVSKLPKYFDLVQQIDVRIEEQPHKKGFHAEITVDVEHHEDFVANAEGPDLYACIDEATERAQRQLHDFKEKLKQGKRGGMPGGGTAGV
ncbi:MAG: ribosome hibernation-promoting factor, HPF/YfiA family [Phycisphaerales bacterium]